MWQNANNWGICVKGMWEFFALFLNCFKINFKWKTTNKHIGRREVDLRAWIGLHSCVSNAIFSKRPSSSLPPAFTLHPLLCFIFPRKAEYVLVDGHWGWTMGTWVYLLFFYFCVCSKFSKVKFKSISTTQIDHTVIYICIFIDALNISI